MKKVFGGHSQTFLSLILLLCATVTQADQVPLWELDTNGNKVFVLGSVHFLRSSDYPLAAEIDEAYAGADRIVMEIDMDDLDPMQAQAVMTQMGMSDGQSLSDAIGESGYSEAQQLAGAVDIPLALFETFEPWFAALSISQLRMMQLGFDPGWGIETQLTQRAARDGKPISGLETLTEQLSFMDGLDDETQRLFLLESLREANEIDEEIRAIVAAWKTGDSDALETMLLDGLTKAPELYDAILTQRNRNWVAKIEELVHSQENVLIVVGTMHLVGDNSVLAMLADNGINSWQVGAE